MTAKKKVPRKKKVTKKLSVPKKTPTNTSAIDIGSDDDILAFNIWGENGDFLGTVEGTSCELHRVALVAQSDSLQNGGDYVPIFAQALTKKYGVEVNDVAAYKMANEIFLRFAEQKKSTDG